MPTVMQNVACNGDPRGLTLSPDGRFLYACNMMAGSISIFTVAEDGSLTFLNNDTRGVSPANLVFV